MSEQENIMIVRKIFDSLNSHNLDAGDQYAAADMHTVAAGSPEMTTNEQNKMYTRRFLDAFPDLHFQVKDMIAQGDKVAASWVVSGTHEKPLATPMGTTVPPTNKKVMVPGVTIVEIRNNKVVHQEIYWDQLVFLTQLGIVTEQDMAARMR